ncbi:MAG: ORF6N domain-containing protein [Crocinitomicaceae bacterium]|nr:ORF6N domain-containing protein [Crocinitomicaceae bacterium]
MTKLESVITDEHVLNKIYEIRGEKVMLDRDLAQLYGVETKYLKRQVKRNVERFPADFMFELSKEEFENWRCQFGTSNSSDKMSFRVAPFAFTEQGVAQLSSVLNSQRAILVNIQIIRLFTRMRKMILSHNELMKEIDEIRKKVADQDNKIELVFDYLTKFITQNEQEVSRKQIGFKTKKNR